jgi:hypothetical protein
MAKVNLDSLDYTAFIEYLNSKNILYGEEKEVDVDYLMDEIMVVTPLESRVKERYFSTDGGHQLFY